MNKKILLIDDDRELCEEISDVLQDEGYYVDKAHDGIAGMKLMEKGRYDILLLDLKIPGIDGYKILEDVKKSKNTVKVIVVTGSPAFKADAHKKVFFNEEKKSRVLEMADGIVSKPFDIEELLDKIGIVKP